jgi:UDP-N-acetylglucosamine:LPS N-acetylglucosamine transferase
MEVATLLDDPARLKQTRDAAGRMARPNALADIAQDALALVN